LSGQVSRRTTSGITSAALQKVGATPSLSLGRRRAMLDFICPTCGHFSIEDEACATCDGSATEDLAA
jgi:hypothetical protein